MISVLRGAFSTSTINHQNDRPPSSGSSTSRRHVFLYQVIDPALVDPAPGDLDGVVRSRYVQFR